MKIASLPPACTVSSLHPCVDCGKPGAVRVELTNMDDKSAAPIYKFFCYEHAPRD